MKRAKNLYQNIVDRNNIRLAICHASKMKKDRKVVQKVLDDLDYYVEEIHIMLEKKTYLPSPYTELKIHDGTRKKVRIICKPAFYPDQIIHWAVMQVIQPVIERGMYELCCASVPGRGIHYATRYIERILVNDRKNTKYCLSIDIHHFYASIDRQILKWKIYKIIKDKDTIDLLFQIIDCYENGVPIRIFYITMACQLLHARCRPLY